MRELGVLLAAALLAGFSGPVVAQVDVEPYIKKDAFQGIKISPGVNTLQRRSRVKARPC